MEEIEFKNNSSGPDPNILALLDRLDSSSSATTSWGYRDAESRTRDLVENLSTMDEVGAGDDVVIMKLIN